MHIPKAENKGMVGTARYKSINSHLGQNRVEEMIQKQCVMFLRIYIIDSYHDKIFLIKLDKIIF